MNSKVVVHSHPLHPMLIPFPFAFLTAATVADVARLRGGPRSWTLIGGYLGIAGVATALLAAVPGFIDYLFVVPPRSSGKKRATQHMAGTLSAVALFAAAVWLRGAPEFPASGVVAGFEVAGLAALAFGGWLGGTLVYRNQIGIDHRYANAGRWREQTFERGKDEPLVVATADELKVNQMKLLHINGRRVVLARTEDGYVAFEDRCTHRGGPLADGALICGTVQCPWHGSQFNTTTGTVKQGPAKQKIDTYKVTERGGEVWMTR